MNALKYKQNHLQNLFQRIDYCNIITAVINEYFGE